MFEVGGWTGDRRRRRRREDHIRIIVIHCVGPDQTMEGVELELAGKFS